MVKPSSYSVAISLLLVGAFLNIGMCIFSIHPYVQKNFYLTDTTSSVTTTTFTTNASRSNEKLSLAMAIVQRAYNDTFFHVVQHCRKSDSMKKCISNVYGIIQQQSSSEKRKSDDQEGNMKNIQKNAVTGYGNSRKNKMLAKRKIKQEWPPSPFSSRRFQQYWWFQSMLRDAKDSALYGYWHVGQTTYPNVTMCMIEKTGIKHWKALFRLLNNDTRFVEGLRSDKSRSSIKLPAPLNIDDSGAKGEGYYYPTFVILRDPLERFLSAYLDKCVDANHRKNRKECGPDKVFNDGLLTRGFSFGDGAGNDVDSGGGARSMFSLYVDTLPLRWNYHFFPQSLFCDGMYRFVDDYDYVGHMDSMFYHNLDELGKHYGGRFETALKKVFDYPSKITPMMMTTGDNDGSMKAMKKEDVNASINVGIETKASDKVLQYYTPKSLRRVLEYVSIDYMLLGLDIPRWAEEMLLREEQKEVL